MLGNRSIAEAALGEEPGGAVAYVLSVDVGAFALTGVAAIFNVTAPETVGTFALSGQSALFTATIAETVGDFALTGNATTFAVTMAEAMGSYALTGNDAAFIGTLSAGVGAYVLTGQDISFFLDTRAITDTDILLLPVDYVLAGQQEKFRDRYRTWEIPAYKRTEKVGATRSGAGNITNYGGRKGALRHAFNE